MIRKANASFTPKPNAPISVFVMDLLCIVPYYTAPLCQALKAEAVAVGLGSIDYRCDRDCFARYDVPRARGIVNVTSKFGMPQAVRRPLKLMENIVNLICLAGRIATRRPDVLHVQFLYLIQYHLRLEIWILKLAKAMGSKVVHTVHNVLPTETGLKYKKVFTEIYHLADKVICHNEPSKARLAQEFGVPAEKISIIPHGPLFADTVRPRPEQARASLRF
jgi:glycosyltransferase involved in cell wall biosynthesis